MLLKIMLLAIPIGLSGLCSAQEVPYFVAYSHHTEEQGSLEIETKTAIGRPPEDKRFFGNSIEFEYGTRAWWTSEVYVDFTGTQGDSTVLGGFRFENRIRPLMREHWINPVLYAEFEDINGANKSILEVVGHDRAIDLAGPVASAHAELQREVELKLILSSDVQGWNIAENLIFEKNLANSPWEFGYALAASRPLALRARSDRCTLCPQNLIAGAEFYGGLGNRYTPGLHDTSHYAGPTVGWQLPGGPRFSAETSFGLNSNSLDHILRVGIAYEIGQLFGRKENQR